MKNRGLFVPFKTLRVKSGPTIYGGPGSVTAAGIRILIVRGWSVDIMRLRSAAGLHPGAPGGTGKIDKAISAQRNRVWELQDGVTKEGGIMQALHTWDITS